MAHRCCCTALAPILALTRCPGRPQPAPWPPQSWLCGKYVQLLEPEAVALGSSRGYESPSSKRLLRQTVLASDAAVFLPAVLAAAAAFGGGAGAGGSRLGVLAALLFSPAVLLIDHGHFQYNCIGLGLAAGAAAAAAAGRHALGALLFSLSLNHKQMGLYYAPAFFAYLLGRCLQAPGLAGKVRGRESAWLPVAHGCSAVQPAVAHFVGRTLYYPPQTRRWAACCAWAAWWRPPLARCGRPGWARWALRRAWRPASSPPSVACTRTTWPTGGAPRPAPSSGPACCRRAAWSSCAPPPRWPRRRPPWRPRSRAPPGAASCSAWPTAPSPSSFSPTRWARWGGSSGVGGRGVSCRVAHGSG